MESEVKAVVTIFTPEFWDGAIKLIGAIGTLITIFYAARANYNASIAKQVSTSNLAASTENTKKLAVIEAQTNSLTHAIVDVTKTQATSLGVVAETAAAVSVSSGNGGSTGK